jgi:flagellar biosynthetic protein FlhB
MAGEKTEKATPKKRKDARKEGNVFKSIDVNNSISIFASVFYYGSCHDV